MIGETLHTKWGTAKVYDGYYKITSSKEGNSNKRLHRLIYEDFWGVKLPKEIIIHHKDENKLNNCILNLEAIEWGKHTTHHWTNRNHTSESKQKISDARMGLSPTLDEKLAISKSKNTTGYFRVTTQPAKTCNQGFVYVYKYYDENHKRNSIVATKIENLKKKVLEKGLIWIKLEEIGK